MDLSKANFYSFIDQYADITGASPSTAVTSVAFAIWLKSPFLTVYLQISGIRPALLTLTLWPMVLLRIRKNPTSAALTELSQNLLRMRKAKM